MSIAEAVIAETELHDWHAPELKDEEDGDNDDDDEDDDDEDDDEEEKHARWNCKLYKWSKMLYCYRALRWQPRINMSSGKCDGNLLKECIWQN